MTRFFCTLLSMLVQVQVVLLLVVAVLVSGSTASEPYRVDSLDHHHHHQEEAQPPQVPPAEVEAEVEVVGPEYANNDIPEIRRYECPAGFFRLRRFCYYLSAGTAQWKEAHFACEARNASLAVLDKPQKDKILRKYLMGDQFRQLERWIGGIYNWKSANWDWGVSGEKVKYRNFGATEQPAESRGSGFGMSCIVLDPGQQYKWASRSCLEPKYFVCEVPAGRTGKSRRRKNIVADPLAPQNQRLRPVKDSEDKLLRRKNKLRSMRKKNWQDDNQVWAHGFKPGSRSPKRGFYAKKRARLQQGKAGRHGRKHKLEQATPRPGDGFSSVGHLLGNSLSDETNHQSQLSAPARFGDIAHEEILLKLHLP